MHVDFKTTHIDEGFPILLRAFPCTASHLFLHPLTASPLSKCSTHEYLKCLHLCFGITSLPVIRPRGNATASSLKTYEYIAVSP